MQSRLDAKRDREKEDDQFNERVKSRLSYWNLDRNRAEEDQLKRYEDYRHNKFLEQIGGDSANSVKRVSKTVSHSIVLKDPHEKQNEAEQPESTAPKSQISERIRLMRINNAKILGLDEDNVKLLKDIAKPGEEATLSQPLIETKDLNHQSNILLSYSHPDLRASILKGKQMVNNENDNTRPNTSMTNKT